MITLIGMGSGTPESLTAQGLAALQNAGLILGAKRLLEQLPQGCTDHRKALYQPEDVLAALAADPEVDAALVYSGDTGFYSGAAQLLPMLRAFGISCRVLPGLSSVQLLAAAVGRSWQEWPQPIRLREPAALEAARTQLAGEVDFWKGVQYLFCQQWKKLKSYANEKGISILGDLPIYTALDSADVWSERREFLLDKAGRPSRVAGVPPDYFSEEGQLWGNPLYDWAAQKRDGFGWWIRRVEGASRLFDAIRIDHFRAFEQYWSIPAGAETAKEGQWEPGPGMDLLRVLTGWFPHITYIAEDLGLLTPEVHQLREAAGLPGMKVLEFAFSDPGNEYLPHNYGSRRCVCYTGTHDNDTALGWYDHAGEAERAFAERYLGASGRENVRQALLRCGMGSTAELFVAQMQDYLALGSEGRINVPGVAAGNWRWRMAPGAAAAGLAADIRRLTEVYGRC